MSYALETKKRKFDRLLESLTDGGAGSQARSSINSYNNASTSSLIQDSASDTSKRRRITSTSVKNVSTGASTNSLTGVYLPSSRVAFLERLETFRHVVKWHVPSTEPINASAWAKRGWTCVDTDTVFCGSCKERIRVDLELDNKPIEDVEGARESHQDEGEQEEDIFTVAVEIYENLVKRYQEMIISAHAGSCPWRRRGCDASIQRIEGLLNVHTALSALQTRYNSIAHQALEVPEVTVFVEDSQVRDEELRGPKFGGEEGTDLNAIKLALCGWQRKAEDVIECQNCFRSLGLWLYRGVTPTMERLDAVESHLEYCPWRSAQAQDTEITTNVENRNKGSQEKNQAPGWLLVYQAVVRDNAKTRVSERSKIMSVSDGDTCRIESESPSASDPVTPEQREKKMKELMRRIREIKKPFNVKSLLKRKVKPNA